MSDQSRSTQDVYFGPGPGEWQSLNPTAEQLFKIKGGQADE